VVVYPTVSACWLGSTVAGVGHGHGTLCQTKNRQMLVKNTVRAWQKELERQERKRECAIISACEKWRRLREENGKRPIQYSQHSTTRQGQLLNSRFKGKLAILIQSGSDNRTPDNWKILISRQIGVRISNFGRHFDLISGPISYICPDAKLDHFIEKRVTKIFYFWQNGLG
jgi:hypothetical protein